MDRAEAYAVPLAVMKEFLPKLNQTRREDGKSYWHVVITKTADSGLALYSSPTGEKINLSPYAFSLQG